MAASTLEELIDDLNANLQWRRIELQALRSEIESIDPHAEDTPRGRALLRSGVALLYAHWEGFTKEACQQYLDFVARRRLKLGELSDAFVMLALERLAGRLAVGDGDGSAAFLEIARHGPMYRPHLPRRDVVLTQGNLRFRTLASIFSALGMPLGEFDTKSKLIDRRLCDARNDIAHGRALFPRREDFLSLHLEVLSLMETVRETVCDEAGGARYRSTD
jgi:hypothetical protein